MKKEGNKKMVFKEKDVTIGQDYKELTKQMEEHILNAVLTIVATSEDDEVEKGILNVLTTEWALIEELYHQVLTHSTNYSNEEIEEKLTQARAEICLSKAFFRR